jgi:hypothetical protein
MKNWFRLLCSAFCFLNITLPGNVLATSLDEGADQTEERSDQVQKEESEYTVAFMTGNFDLESVSMKVGNPIDALLLYLGDANGKIVTDAQVVIEVIDQHGNKQASRASQYKCGYFVAIDQLPVGPYRAEAEIIANAQLQTKEFMFSKA